MADFTPRPTVYRGVKMRSRLEAGYAQWLDSWGCKWEYEPCAFGSEAGQYLPDFRLPELRVSWDDAPLVAYVEVKPTHAQAMADSLINQMRVILDSEPGSLLCVQYPGQAAHSSAGIDILSHLTPVGLV